MAQELSLKKLLSLIVENFASRPHLALARIWLVKPSANCKNCLNHSYCSKLDGEQSNCLHLCASAGQSILNPKISWSKTGGRYTRIPIGQKIIGKVGATGQQIEITNLKKAIWNTEEQKWIKREKIKGFCAEPLIYRGKILGVMAILVRIPIPANVKGNLGWLRLIANHAAIAIANAKAFEKIVSLTNQLKQENAYLKQEITESQEFDKMLGKSEAITILKKQIEKVSITDASVLIEGETGTGKELVARQIHNLSKRRDKPLIKVNCASISKELWESEFFGHVKGAFTGAHKNRAGRFELANGGTLFLDEVGEIPIDLQTKLLRVLQEGQFERVGDDKTKKVDVRIIAATNKPLTNEVNNSRFRQDLYYRLAVFPIIVAPLRQRKKDIPILAAHFLKTSAKKHYLPALLLSKSIIKALSNYQWPGNIRELQNVIERATITKDKSQLLIVSNSTTPDISDTTDIYQDLQKHNKTKQSFEKNVLTESQMLDIEANNIIKALKQTNGKIYGTNGAAALLEIKPTTLASRIKKFNIEFA